MMRFSELRNTGILTFSMAKIAERMREYKLIILDFFYIETWEL